MPWPCRWKLGRTPTPRKVNDAIGRGQPKEAVRLLSDLLNKEGDITTAKLESLLDALTLNRRFTLDAADDLFDRLKPDGKSAILKWYIQVYLERAEKPWSKTNSMKPAWSGFAIVSDACLEGGG